MRKRSVRVALVQRLFPRYMEALLRELRSFRDVEFEFIGDSKAQPGTGLELASIPGDAFRRAETEYLLGGVTWQRHLGRAIRKGQFDTVILEGDAHIASSWTAAIESRGTGRSVLMWTHGWLNESIGPKESVRAAFYSLADGLLLYGDRARAIGMRRGFNPSRLFVVYNCLDAQRQREAAAGWDDERLRAPRRRLFGESEAPIVVFSGRLTSSKRPDLVLEALEELARRSHVVHGIFIGDGPMLGRLRGMAEKGMSRIAFVGACQDEESLTGYFLLGVVTVIPASAGLSVIHSGGYGTPVLTHADASEQGPEWEAIEPGKNGWPFSGGDVGDLIRCLQIATARPMLASTERERIAGVVKTRYNATSQAARFREAVLTVRNLATTESRREEWFRPDSGPDGPTARSRVEA